MKAVSEFTRNLPADNRINRRQALHGAAAVGALALPAGAAVATSKMAQATNLRDFIIASQTERPELWPDLDYVPPAHVEPLIGLWQERQAAKAAADAGAYGPDADDLVDRMCEIECRIAGTAPVSPEGLAIIATLMMVCCADMPNPDDAGLEEAMAATMARYILDTTPADVKRRAGLEG